MAPWQIRDNLRRGKKTKQHLYWRHGNGLAALSTTNITSLLVWHKTVCLPSLQNYRNSLTEKPVIPGCSASSCWHSPNTCCRTYSRWQAPAGFPGRAAGLLLLSGCCQLIQRWLRKRQAQHDLFWSCFCWNILLRSPRPPPIVHSFELNHLTPHSKPFPLAVGHVRN